MGYANRLRTLAPHYASLLHDDGVLQMKLAVVHCIRHRYAGDRFVALCMTKCGPLTRKPAIAPSAYLECTSTDASVNVSQS